MMNWKVKSLSIMIIFDMLILSTKYTLELCKNHMCMYLTAWIDNVTYNFHSCVPIICGVAVAVYPRSHNNDK